MVELKLIINIISGFLHPLIFLYIKNNKKGLFKYFSQHNSLYLLSDTLEFLADKEIIKPGTYGNKKKGVGNYGQVAPYGRRCIRDYLLKPVEMERQIEKADGSVECKIRDKDQTTIRKLYTDCGWDRIEFGPYINGYTQIALIC